LAFIVTNKFVDGLPLHRLERVFNRLDIAISRQTLARWVIRSGVLVQVLINLLRDQLLDDALIHMDETRMLVLNEPDRPARSQSNIWVQRGGPPDKPIILFHYHPSRSAEVATRLLDGFAGALVTDGYEGYAAAVRTHQLTHAGCWAHARRKFDEAVKAQTPKGKKPKAGKATRALGFIRKLYRVERLARDQGLSPEQRLAFRQQHAQPVIDELQAWLQTSLSQVPPKSAVGKALHYLNNQWGKLTVYLTDGRIPIDNNPAENAIRPFVIGRKAWLFADTVAGAEASANLYSLVETAKANGLEPYRYLRHIFTHLPAADSVEAFEALLPTRVDPDTINALPL
jgi:transposase